LLPLRTTASCACIAFGAVATAADAATVTFDRACYSPGEPVIETGAGFTPGSSVVENLTLLSNDPAGIVSSFMSPPSPVDPAGGFIRGLLAPPLGRATDRQETAMSVFTDQAVPDVPVTAQWTLTGWDVELSSPGGKVTRRGRMQVDTWGWTSAGQTLYAHWYRKGKRVKSARIGALAQPCGDLITTTRQFPFDAKPGKWKLYFSTTSPFDKAEDPAIGFSVRLRRASRASRTAAVRSSSRGRDAHALRPIGAESGRRSRTATR
jgi:hypothetical protein